MEFDLVISTLLKEFDEEDVHYAVIGGCALGFWGVVSIYSRYGFFATRGGFVQGGKYTFEIRLSKDV